MANPNIAGLSNIFGGTAYIKPGTLTANTAWTYNGANTITGLTPATNQVNKVEGLLASNYTTTSSNVTIMIADNATFSSGNTYYVAYQVTVPAYATLVITDKNNPIYITEYQSVGVQVGTANSISVTATFETIS